MSAFSPFGIPGFDPSKMDPKILMELSQLIQKLPAEQLSRMQTLMHNTMAGYDTKKEMEEFERNLPPDFREKLFKILGSSVPASYETRGFQDEIIDVSSRPVESASSKPSGENHGDSSHAEEMNLHQARLTILRAVASGTMQPEEAEKLLFTA